MGFEQRPGPRTVVERKDGSPSETVILAVAEAEDVAPTELRSLYRVVDPDALDALLRRDGAGTVTFEYHGYMITVRESGRVIVQTSAPEES